MYAEVCVGYPVEGSFLYGIPAHRAIKSGQRVRVDFAGRVITGFVTGLRKEKPEGLEIKEIGEIIDREPIFDERLIRLAEYVTQKYLSFTGEVLSMALPSGLNPSGRFIPPFEKGDSKTVVLTEKQKKIYQNILDSSGDKRLHLIFGITGSGKTEIYLELARHFLKRGLSATIEEWLMSAEYILSEGNDQVVLCERGIRTFERHTRNTLDLTAVPVIKELTHLPIIVDPSHATGMRDKVSPMARAAIAAGADGLTIEVHTEPDKALSDGPQSLYPEQFKQLMRDLYVIAPVVGKQLDTTYLEKAALMTKSFAPGEIPGKVVYHGVPGSFSHKACLQFFGTEVPHQNTSSFRELFQTVHNGEARLGIIPVENSLSGSIHENYDLLLEYDLKIVGELTLRVKHYLIGLEGASPEAIKRVYSHPQVFQQCREFLARRPEWDVVACQDTASGVQRVKTNGDPQEAAIASREAAELFDMKVLEEGIETNPRNFTRFVVISREEFLDGPRNKSSLIFSVSDRPGSLYQTLKIFADRNVNLVKLESRPIHSKPWEYLFYADVEIDIHDAQYQDLLEELKEKTEFLKVLGSYCKGIGEKS